jgi:hypothetical protein
MRPALPMRNLLEGGTLIERESNTTAIVTFTWKISLAGIK